MGEMEDGDSRVLRGGSIRRRLMPPLWLWLFALIYAVVFSGLSVIKHDRFHSFALDLGIMSQVTWNTSHGRAFETSLDRAEDTEVIGSYHGNHVRPIFLLLAPLYRLWPDPRLLLILQSVALALGAVPLYWVARRRLRSFSFLFVLILSYFLYPALGFISLFDFHPVAFCVPTMLVAYWALLENRRTLLWAMVLLTLSTKEELVIPVAAFGAYCLTQKQWRRTGVWLLAVAAGWAVVSFGVLIPTYNEGRAYRFFDLWSHLLTSAGDGGGGGGLAGSIGSSSVDAIYFVVHLLVPLGFTPLLGPGLSAVALPSLAYLLLSSRTALHSVGFQYPAVLIPWLFLGAIHGLAKLERWARARSAGRRWLPLCLIVVGTLGAQLKFNPVYVTWLSGYFTTMPHDVEIRTALDQISPQAAVATGNSFGPHLTHRRYLLVLEKYSLPLRQDHLQHADYVLLDLVDCRLVRAENPRAAYGEMVRQVLETRQFGVRYWSGRILLLDRGAPLGPELDEVQKLVDHLVATERPCWP